MFRRMISWLLLTVMLLQLIPFRFSRVNAAEGENPTAEVILACFNHRSYGQHPRILSDEAKFERLRLMCNKDSYLRTWYDGIYDYCEWIMKNPLSDYTAMYSYAKTASDRIIHLAFLYRLSGEARFADQAVREMLAVISHETWTKDENCLIIALAACGLGIGYDWLYDYMPQATRDTLAEGIYNCVIHKLLTIPYWWVNTYCNINPWTYGLVSIAALAIMERYPQECGELLSQGVSSVRNYIAYLSPGGAFVEGGGYYRAVMTALIMMLDNMNCVLGTTFGLAEAAGLREAASYLPAMNSDVSSFNHGDCQPAIYSGPFLYWFANQYHLPELYLWQRSKTVTDYRNTYMKDHFLSMLWYDPSYIEGYTQTEAQKDYLLYSDEYESYASFRETLSDGKELYAAIKGGRNKLYHSDLDVGTFVLDAMGVRWFDDLGKGDYEASGYFTYEETASRWTYYRKRTEGQNTLVINPQAPSKVSNYGGQDAEAFCQITDYSSSYDGGYALVDMTDAYDSYYGASSVQRGLALFDNRSRVLLRDEITCEDGSEIYWFAHTTANISLSQDKKTATLTKNGKTLTAQIVSPSNGSFSVMAASPLADSPNPSGQADNSAYKKLTIHLTNVSNPQIEVIFTPLLPENHTSSLPDVSLQSFGTLVSPYPKGSTLPQNEAGEYEIYDADQLFLFAELVNQGNSFAGKTVKLMKDIDLQNRSFVPIGGCSVSSTDRGKVFSGTFDGCGHEIRNLLIYQPRKHFVALFGATVNATIRNLGVNRCKVYASTKAACLVALAIHTSIDNCFSRGDATSSGADAGGLTAQVSGTISITSSYHNGNVESTRYSGGLLGYLSSQSTLTIENCFYAGSINGGEGFTGMIGYYGTSGTYAATAVQLRNCYSTAELKGSAVESGSIESYTDCLTVTKPALVSYAVELGDSFIYDCQWKNDGCPVLKWQCDTVLPEDYVLTTEAQLRLLAYTVNSGADSFEGKLVRLGADIDLKLHEWTPIGGNSTDSAPGNPFRGTFDGNGHTVSNLKITSGHSFVGLLGYMRNATIQKVGLEKSSITANLGAGLVGYAYTGSRIRQCYSKAAVSGYSGIGGILGMVGGQNCEILDCYYTGSLTTTVSGAGVLGYLSSDCRNISVKNSYCAGDVPYGIVGIVNAAATDCSVHNSYCLDSYGLVGTANTLTVTESASLRAETLSAYAPVLGSSYNEDCPFYHNNFPILAWQHFRSAVIREGVEAGCTEKGLTEGKDCSVCGKVLVAREEIPALGHSYEYTNSGNESHSISCTNCDFAEISACSYENGKCICGAVEVSEPICDESLKLFHSLTLKNDISINYVLPKTALQGCEDIRLDCVLPEYEGKELVGRETLSLSPVENGDYYYFTLDAHTAVSMNDEIQATLFLTREGKDYVSPTDCYSVARYAYSQLSKESTDSNLKTLCADLLRYGAAAQRYKGYRTDSLADAAMTEAQKAYLSDEEAVTFGSTDSKEDDCQQDLASWVGKTLLLDSKVTLRYVLNLSGYSGDFKDLRLKLRYKGIDGQVITAEVSEFSPYSNHANLYAFDFDGLLAAELRCPVTAALYAGDTQISDSLLYSPDSYGKGKTGTLLALCKALFAYSDSAKGFFTDN